MKRYYVHYYRDFGNTYSLYWADSPEMEARLPDGARRITRARAVELARAERERRRYDESFSYYATPDIYPADFPVDDDPHNQRRYELRGYIWERRPGK